MYNMYHVCTVPRIHKYFSDVSIQISEHNESIYKRPQNENVGFFLKCWRRLV